jgi:hypothetical protein
MAFVFITVQASIFRDSGVASRGIDWRVNFSIRVSVSAVKSGCRRKAAASMEPMLRVRNLAILLTVLTGIGVLVATVVWGIRSGLAEVAGSETTSNIAFGNQDGHFPVPASGQAVNTSNPNQVVGNGTPANCTSAAVVQAVAAGGIITFNCGANPITIVMTATANVAKTEHQVVLDGGGLVTLSGAGQRRILFSDTCAGTLSTDDCVNQPYPQIVVQNMTFENGFNGTPQVACTANIPQCWYGGVNGGGAIYAEGGQFRAVNSGFVNNQCYGEGPDLGGGALRVLAQYTNSPAYITSDTFTGGSCSNGGALSSIDVQWNIANSVFTKNDATGSGANPAASGTPGGGSGGAIYNDGDNHNTNIEGTVMSNNSAREGGGAIFYVVDAGWGVLTLNQSTLLNNPSAAFWTYPGIYDNVDHKDGPPAMINSTDS